MDPKLEALTILPVQPVWCALRRTEVTLRTASWSLIPANCGERQRPCPYYSECRRVAEALVRPAVW